MRVYLIGPYNGDSIWAIKQNVEEARTVARELWASGYAVLCPHTNTEFMDGPDLSADRFIEGDIEWLSVADAVVLLPGWEQSRGSQAELNAARKFGIPVYVWPERP